MMKKKIKINKIVAGGQSGVDRSALDFSIKNNIPHGGWCPKNRWAEDGIIPTFYNLTETVEEASEARTLKNVVFSDGTLIIFKNTKDLGTFKTIEFCIQNNKAFFEIDLTKKIEKEQFNHWLISNNIKVLNVAGSRESNSPERYNETTSLLKYLVFG